MNTSATRAHLVNKLFEAQFQATIYHPNPEHTRMWRERRKRLSRAVDYLASRLYTQLEKRTQPRKVQP